MNCKNSSEYLRIYDTITTGKNCGKKYYEKFWESVNIKNKDECWEWNKKLYDNKYGQFTIGHNYFLSHRVSYFLCYEYLPPELMHTCDNKKCTNPYHLIPCSHSANMVDMVRKGRGNYKYGLQHSRGKVSDLEVQLIKEMKNTDLPRKHIARFFGISTNHVERIQNNKRRVPKMEVIQHEIPV